MVEYSRRVSEDEAATLTFVNRCFDAFRELSANFDASIVKTMGDGILVEFVSTIEALRFALDIHKVLESLQEGHRSKTQFRVGIHVGEVERTDADVYGHVVNVASRLVALAKPGGICVSQDVFQQARHDPLFGFSAGGLTRLKNIPEPMAIYHVLAPSDASEKSTSKLTVGTIGSVSVSDEAGRRAELRSEHVRALLGYLALSPGHSDYKERLAALLWSERDAQSARRALAQCLRSTALAFRNLANSPLLQKADQIILDENTVAIDLDDISEKVTLGVIDDLLIERPDWPDALLRGTETLGPLYLSWLRVTRHNWRTRIADALEVCLGRFDVGDVGLRRAANALLGLEPGHEIAVQKLISHYAHHQNIAMAMKLFKEFSAYLSEQFQISPSSATTSLIKSIADGRWNKPAKEAVGSSPTGPIPTLAIAAIDSLGSSEKHAHIAAGFRNELLANLARFRDWVVQETADPGSDTTSKVAAYSLTLSSTERSDGSAILLRLIENEGRRIVWSETVDVDINTWFESLRKVIRQVAARLQIYLSSDRLSRIIGSDESILKSYDAWLRAEHLLSLWQPSAEDEAELVLKKIVATDPRFAPASASLASIYNVRHLIRPGLPLDAHQRKQALPLAKAAVEIDPLDSRNHLVVAWSSAMAGEFEKAAIHYELAVSLNPIHPKLLLSAAQGMAFLGDSARARDLMDAAVDGAPFLLPYQWCYICSTCWMIGDYDGAVRAAKLGEAATVDTHGWRAASLSMLGDIAAAKASFSEQVQALEKLWAGENPLTSEGVMLWFTSAFPIARQFDRNRLRQALLSSSS